MARTAANGEAVIVNGGIHLETSVNCSTQYPAPGCSHHRPVPEHTQIHTNRNQSDHWRSGRNVITPPQRARHRGGRRRGGEETKESHKERGGTQEAEKLMFPTFDSGHRADETDPIDLLITQTEIHAQMHNNNIRVLRFGSLYLLCLFYFVYSIPYTSFHL